MTDLNPKLHTPDGTSLNVKNLTDTEHLRRSGEDVDSEAPPSGGSGEANTASNVGAAAGEVFKVKSGVDLQFRTLQAGANITISTGTNVVTVAVTGLGALATLNTVGTSQIDDNAVTNGKLRDSAALSVIGRASNSAGDPADIAAGTDHQVLRRSGTTIGFGAVNLAQAAAVTGALPVAHGGSGQTTGPAAFAAFVDSLSAGTALTLSHLLGFSTGGGAHKKTVQALFDIINSLAAKTTPVDADKLLLIDSAASNVAKSVTAANLKAYIGGGSVGAARAYKSSDGTVGTGAQKVPLNAETYDVDSYFDTSNNRFLPSVAGKYMFVGTVTINTFDTSNYRAMLYKNGSVHAWGSQIRSGSTASNELGIVVSDVIDMNGSTDYVELWAEMGANRNIQGGAHKTFMAAYKVD